MLLLECVKIAMDIKKRVSDLKRDIPALYLSVKAKDTPVLAKLLAFVTVAYALSPIDLIPDFVPVLGYLDDIIILPVLITITISLVPKPVLYRCREQAENAWDKGKPKKWYYAMPVILIWIVLAYVIVKMTVGRNCGG